MSGPVDVLAVMQYAANETEAMIWRAQNPKIPGVTKPGEGFRIDEIVHPDTQDALDRLTEARAAVAELIEADRELDAAEAALRTAVRPDNPATPDEWMQDSRWRDLRDGVRAAKKRRAAALARVGGAK